MQWHNSYFNNMQCHNCDLHACLQDLKPSNVAVNEDCELRVRKTPLLMLFQSTSTMLQHYHNAFPGF